MRKHLRAELPNPANGIFGNFVCPGLRTDTPSDFLLWDGGEDGLELGAEEAACGAEEHELVGAVGEVAGVELG